MARKANRQITLDMELLTELDNLKLNVSEYCNEKLWAYVNKLSEVKKSNENPKDIDLEIKELEKKKEAIKWEEEIGELMKAEGMTQDKIKFLKSMNTNPVVAKDMKQAWFNKFGEDIQWLELLKLKDKWNFF